MRIQLFVPPQGYIAQRWMDGNSMPPLGILYLGAVLEKSGFDIEIVPADALKLDWKSIARKIMDFKPSVVGVTTTTENRFDSFKLVKMVKSIDPEIKTILGGPHISMAGLDTITNIMEADYLVTGEGEATLPELAQAIRDKGDISRVKGIYYRKNNNDPVFTGPRLKIADLDTLPYPGRHLIPMDKYNFTVESKDGKKRRAQNIITSRGCPFNCYFCATPVTWGRNVRGHSPPNIVNEIEHLIDKYSAEFIWFYDDTLNYNPERLARIMDLIIERKFNIRFANEFRIDTIDKPLLEKMRKAGLERGYYGIEAGADRIRKDIVNKKFEIEKAYQFHRWAREFDFIPGPFFIFSNYTEEWEEARESVRIMEELKAINPESDISTAILHVYPGTTLEEIAKKEGIIPADFIWAKKKDMKRVPTLPAAQGYVPLFKHKLKWRQIAELVMGFSQASNKGLSISKIKNTITSVTSLKEFFIDLIFLMVLLKNKIKKVLM